MRKSAIPVVMILLLISLPMLYMTPNSTPNQTTETTTTITAQRAGGTPHLVVYLTNNNFSGALGTGGTDNWTYTEWGNNPYYATGGTHATYHSSPVSAFLRLRSTSSYSLQCELGWTQPFTYTGTANITFAYVTFWWRCYSYTYAGSTNYLEIWFEAPEGSSNWVKVGGNIPFSSTTNWAYKRIDITSQLKQWTNQYGAATYGFEADAYLTTSGSGPPDVRVLYDDIQIAVNYNTTERPQNPTVVINGGATYTKFRNVTLNLGASGADLMSFRNENNATWSSWETFSSTKQWTLSSGDGAKTVYFQARNTAGNSTTASNSITYDGSPPNTPSLSSPANGTALRNSAPTFTWSSVTDVGPSGLASYTFEYSTDKTFGSGVTTVTGLTGTSYTPSQLVDNTWYWHVRAVDNAGNLGSWSSPYRVIIVDTVYPSAPTLVGPSTGNVTSNNKPTFTWSNASDASPSSGIANYTLQLDTTSQFNSGNLRTITITTGKIYTVPSGSPLSDGTWYWRVGATDKAGNVGSYSGYWSITVDTVAPGQPTLSSPSSGTRTNINTPTFTWGAATDQSPSSGIASYTFQIDTSISFNSGNLRTITGITGTSYTVASALSDGPWYWRVNATDNAGNRGSYASYWTIVIDTVAPGQPTLTFPSSGTTTNVNTPTFQWNNATDPVPSSGIASHTLQYSKDSSFATGVTTVTDLGSSYTIPTGSPLSDGTWYWRVRAVDKAGNTGSYSASSYIIVVDTVNPGVPTPTSPTSGSATNNNKPTFTWSSATDPSPSSGITYTIQLDTSTLFNSGNLRTNSSLTATSFTVPSGSPLNDGTWYWHVRADDNAGNHGSYSGYWSIVIDTANPGLPTPTSPTSGSATNNNKPTFTWSSASDPSPSSGITYTLQIDNSTSFNNATGGLRTITGLTTTTYTVPSGSPLRDGTWYWHVRAVDRAGNTGSYFGYWSIVIDTVAPSTPAPNAPPNGGTVYSGTPTFSWSAATDPSPSSGFAYTLQIDTSASFNSGNLRTVTGLTGTSYTVPGGSPLADGTWYWRVRAVDNAGNPGAYFTAWSVVIVTSASGAPTLLSPSNGYKTSNNQTAFTWTKVVAQNYTLYLDTTPFFNSTDLFVKTGLTGNYTLSSGEARHDGTWYWKVGAQPGSKNSTIWSIVIDTKNPSAPTLSSPSNGFNTNYATPTFTWSAASDPAPSSGITYTLQLDTSASFNNGTGNLRIITGIIGTSYTVTSALSDRTWHWRVNATDGAGNVGPWSSTWSIVVDTHAPDQPTLSSPSSGTKTNDNTPDFTWSAATDPSPSSGIASYTFQIDTSTSFNSGNLRTITGITGTSYTVPSGSPLADSTWYWRVKAIDNAGNTGTYSAYWSIMIDTVSPGLPSLTSPSTGSATNNSKPTFTWSAATDPSPSSGITYTFQIDTSTSFSSGNLRTITSITVTSYTVPSGSPLSDGTWYWRVRAVDNATNAGSYSGYWSIAVDTVAPGSPTLNSPTDGAQTNITRPVLIWNAATDATSGVSNYTLQYANNPSFTGATTVNVPIGTSYTLSTALAPGIWYWHVKATDRAGNPGSYSGYWNFTVDTLPPTISALSKVGGNYTNSLAITLSISASGAQKMYLSNDGTNWVEYSYTTTKSWNLTAGDGVKPVYFKCKDAAGNWAYLSGGFISITLDTVPPTTGSPSVPATGSIISNSTPTLGWNAGSDTGGSGIANYTLQLDTSPLFNNAGGDRRTITGLTGTSYTVIPALSGGTWYWRFNATDRAYNTGPYSTYSWFLLNTTLPGKIPYDREFWLPQNNSAKNFGSPRFVWNSTEATGAYRYHIQIDRYLNFSSPYLIENLTLPTNHITLVNGTWLPYFSPFDDNNKILTDGTWYWRVEAINLANARSGFLTVQQLTIDTTPPDAPNLLDPVNLTATNIGSYILFEWSSVSDAANYWLQWDWMKNFSSGDVAGYTFTNLTTSSYFYNKERLDEGRWYWRVLSLDLLGNINNSELVPINQLIVDRRPPDKPDPLSPPQNSFTNRNTPTLTWYATDSPVGFPPVASGIASYTLCIDTGSSFNTSSLRTIPGLVMASYTFTGSLSDGTWYWFVTATDRAGNIGLGSIVQNFTVDTIAPTTIPISSMSPGNGETVSENMVTLRWSKSNDKSGIDRYVIQVDSSREFNNNTGNLHTYDVTGNQLYCQTGALGNGQWYWRIYAVDKAGNLGDWSQPIPFTVSVLSTMMVILIGGGSSGVLVLALLGYVFYRRAKIPFVIKKIDQSIKLISKGEMPAPVPMRSRAEIVQTIFRDKTAILSKEKIEALEKKKGKISPEKPAEPIEKPEEATGKEYPEIQLEEPEPEKVEAKQKAVKAIAPGETDVDMIVKELEKLETKEEMGLTKESDFIRREAEELEKAKKKKK